MNGPEAIAAASAALSAGEAYGLFKPVDKRKLLDQACAFGLV